MSTLQIACMAVAVMLAATGVVLAPRRRRRIAVVTVIGLVAIAATPAAFASWTIGAAGDPHTQPTVTSTPFNANSISAPSGLSCAWTNANSPGNTTVNLSWTNNSTFAQQEVQRKTTGSFADYAAAGIEHTSYADSAANSPTSNNYSYQVNARAGSSWTSAYSGTVTSNTCKDALAQIAAGGTQAAINSLLNVPTDVAFDSNGDAIIADTSDHKVRCIAAVTTANACFQASPVVGYIYTIAGTGTSGSLGDGAAATSAKLATPTGVAVDSSGNVLIADTTNCNIRLIWAGGSNNYGINTLYSIGSPTVGNIYRVAGQVSTCGYGGNNAVATTSGSKLSAPQDVAVDSSGNMYISDTGNQRLREVVQSSGKFLATDFAGNGTACASPPTCGDGGAASSGNLNNPMGIAVDSSGDVIFADKSDYEVRMVSGVTANPHFGQNMTAGDIYRIGGTGASGSTGDTGAATSAKLNLPFGIDVDSSGDVVIGDSGNDEVRVIAGTTATHFGVSMTANDMYTIGGVASGTSYTGDGYPAIGTGAANINTPQGVAIDPTHTSNVWVTAGSTSHLLQMIDGTNNLVFTKAGQSGTAGTASNANGDGATSANWELNTVYHTALDSFGNLYMADNGDNRIREWVASTGEVRTVAGTGAQGDGTSGNALAAALKAPDGVAFDSSGNLYIADTGNNKIKKVAITAGGTNGGTIGNISVVAGTGTACATPFTSGCGEGGPATSGTLNAPTDVALDSSNNIIIADEGDCTIRLVAGSTASFYNASRTVNNIYRIGGTFGTCSTSGDGAAATSGTLNNPFGIDVDSGGNIYIAQWTTTIVRIRKIASDDTVSTIAGSGAGSGGSTDGAATTVATFLQPIDVAWDANNSTLYIADSGNSKIRTLVGSTVSTIAGGGSANPGDGGPGLAGTLSPPGGVSVKSNGDLFITSSSAGANVRRLYGPDP